MLDMILGAIGMGGNNNNQIPKPNIPIPNDVITNTPNTRSGSGLVNQMAFPNNPIPKPSFSPLQPPPPKPFYTPPPMTLGDRFKGAGTGLLNNLSTFVKPQDEQQRMANLRFASKLAQLSRPQVGVTNRGIGATIGNIGEALEAYSEGMSPQIFQLGDRLVQLNPDGTTTVLDEGSPEKVEERLLPTKASADELDDVDAIYVSQDLINRSRNFINQIQNGKLVFYAGKTLAENFQIITGTGTEEQIKNSQEFKKFIDRLRNAKLRLAKGVQTEGDAERAVNELITSAETNSEKLIESSLLSLIDGAEVEITKRKSIIDIRRKNAGVKGFDYNQLQLQAPSFQSTMENTSLGSLSAEDQLSQLGL